MCKGNCRLILGIYTIGGKQIESFVSCNLRKSDFILRKFFAVIQEFWFCPFFGIDNKRGAQCGHVNSLGKSPSGHQRHRPRDYLQIEIFHVLFNWKVLILIVKLIIAKDPTKFQTHSEPNVQAFDNIV